jgi:predicted nuclease with TOPRIM domain
MIKYYYKRSRIMKNLKIVGRSAMILFVLICFCVACGGKYDDVVKINEEFIEVLEDYANDLEKADNAKDVAEAINDAAEKLEKLAPKMKELQKKYPDLKTKKDLPEKLVQSEKDVEQVGKRLAGSFMTLVKYIGNPDVMAAQMRLGNAMQSASM